MWKKVDSQGDVICCYTLSICATGGKGYCTVELGVYKSVTRPGKWGAYIKDYELRQVVSFEYTDSLESAKDTAFKLFSDYLRRIDQLYKYQYQPV